MSAKIVVIYPKPADALEFERAYTEDHAPMVNGEAFPGITRFVQVKVLGTPDGSEPQFARLAELHFDSMDDLQKAAGSEGASKAVAHAQEISSGGAPLFLVCEETAASFTGKAATT